MKIKSLCVFCGSSFGNSDIYKKKAIDFAEKLSEKGISLVYGGGSAGLMGVLASTVLAKGGNVTGVIPEMISTRLEAIPGVETIVTPDMHSRKKKMYELADAFTALPGGIGTLEEISEVMTWQQLGYHSKAVSIYNIDGFYNFFNQFLLSAQENGFLKQVHRSRLIIEKDPDVLLSRIEKYSGKTIDKWS